MRFFYWTFGKNKSAMREQEQDVLNNLAEKAAATSQERYDVELRERRLSTETLFAETKLNHELDMVRLDAVEEALKTRIAHNEEVASVRLEQQTAKNADNIRIAEKELAIEKVSNDRIQKVKDDYIAQLKELVTVLTGKLVEIDIKSITLQVEAGRGNKQQKGGE